jgi:cytochrome P450
MSLHEVPASTEEAPAGCPFHPGGRTGGHGKAAAPQHAEHEITAHRALRRVSGPKPAPFIGWRGNLFRYVRDPVSYLGELRRDWGNVVALADGGNVPIIYRPKPEHVKQTVFGFGPEITREVLTQPDVFGGGEFRAPEDAPWINSSMSSVNGERRVQHKSILSPAFAREHLKVYFEEMSEDIERMLAGWENRKQVDLLAEAYALSGRIASRCFYGQSPDRVEDNLAVTIRDFASTLFHPLSAIRLKIPGMPYWRLSRLSARIRHLLKEELKRKEKLDYSGNDALSMMMRAKFDKQVLLSEDELIGSSVGLFLAGHDVPANGFIFLISLLATHPEASRRLMEEIDREIGEGRITYEQIFRLPELDRVFNESLRIINPALLIFRQAQVDTSMGDCRIPCGTEVLLSPFMSSRDPAIFENPQRFQPQRWAKINPSPYEFLPFGNGPRRCLGASFAEIQLKLAITRIFQRFRLTPSSDARLDFKYTFAVQPHGRVKFNLHPQDRKFEPNAGIPGDFNRFVEVPAS